MSKAEERALEKYPQKIEWVGWDGAPFDVNSESRVAYKQGYHQAEKDLELTWADMRELYIIFAEVDTEIELCKTDIQAGTLGYYKEVLKRFKESKGNIKD